MQEDSNFDKFIKYVINGNCPIIEKEWRNEYKHMTDSEGWTALHFAACNARDKVIQKLIEMGLDPDKTAKNGDTPIHKASRYGKINSLLVLIESGANLELQNNFGETAHDLAMKNAHGKCSAIIETVKILSTAFQKDDVKTFKNILLDKNRNIIETMPGVLKPLVKLECPNIIRYLLKSKMSKVFSDKNADKKFVQEFNLCQSIIISNMKQFENNLSVTLANKKCLLCESSALDIALRSGSTVIVKDILKLLEENNPILTKYIDSIESYRETLKEQMIDILADRKEYLDSLYNSGHNRFEIAIMDDCPIMLKYLLKNMEENNHFSKGNIGRAISISLSNRRIACTRILQQYQADYDYINKFGQILLHVALDNKMNVNYCCNLLKFQTNIEARDYLGFTVMQRAVIDGYEKLARKIIKRDKNWNAKVQVSYLKLKDNTPHKCKTINPPYVAYKRQFPSCLMEKLTAIENTILLTVKSQGTLYDWMLKQLTKDDIHFQDGGGDTVLHVAIEKYNHQLGNKLLTISPQLVYVKNHKGYTPLRVLIHALIKGKQIDNKLTENKIASLKLLVNGGAGVDEDEVCGTSVLQAALQINNERILTILADSDDCIMRFTAHDFCLCIKNEYYEFLEIIMPKLHKTFYHRTFDSVLLEKLLVNAPYTLIQTMYSYINSELKTEMVENFLFSAYNAQDEPFFKLLCKEKLVGKSKFVYEGETILTLLIKKEIKYCFYLLGLGNCGQLIDCRNLLNEHPINLLINNKQFSLIDCFIDYMTEINKPIFENEKLLTLLLKQLTYYTEVQTYIEVLVCIKHLIQKGANIYEVDDTTGRTAIDHCINVTYKNQIILYFNNYNRQITNADNSHSIETKAGSEIIDYKLCVICKDQQIDSVLLNCGHTCCSECGYKMNNCYMCRKKIVSIMKMFI